MELVSDWLRERNACMITELGYSAQHHVYLDENVYLEISLDV